jgi:formylglycine-generating enzyme required for sulfatase activity/cold shock CspA family protein
LSRLVILRDARGERRGDETSFPLSLGGAGADVEIAGCGDGVVALIALSDGHAFIQPTGESADVFLNREHLRSSKWLKSGDRIEAGSTTRKRAGGRESASALTSGQASDEIGEVVWKVEGDQIVVSSGLRRRESVSPPIEPPPLNSAARPDSSHRGVRGRHPGQAAGQTGALGTPGGPAGRRRLATAILVTPALVAAYLAIATPVAIEVEPAPEQQSLRGIPPPIPLMGRYLALPGTYAFRATREGYHPLEQKVEVGFEERVGVEAKLLELPGAVEVVLQPGTAHRSLRVMIGEDEQPRGEDGRWHIARGRHTLRLETERYLPHELELDVDGFGHRQTVEVTLEPAWANVRFESEPSGATVTVDGDEIGRTPIDAEILNGEPTIVVSRDDRKPVTLFPRIKAGDTLRLTDIILDPLDGYLVITSEPTSATVTVDGAYAGVTPVQVAVRPDVEHEVRVSEPGYAAATKRVRTSSLEESAVAMILSPEYGTVFMTATPADARLSVDGRELGAATRRLRLTTRRHELTISREGYQSKTLSVTPSAGLSQTLEVDLLTLEAARSEGMTTAAGQRLRLVRPEGEFLMGSSRREPGRRANESRRRVVLTRDFYISETEVTNAQFRQFRAAHDSGTEDDATLDGDDMPAARVSWEDAARYCNWLSSRDGLDAYYQDHGNTLVPVLKPGNGYRLPSEAEWAYVARIAGRTSPARYPWQGGGAAGSSAETTYPPPARAGNFADASIADTLTIVVPGYNDGYRGAAPVASYAPTPAGMYDLAGNVSEWTGDYYAVYPGEDTELVSDPTGPAQGEHRVVRGSSWRHGATSELRASYRDYSDKPRADIGFRIARYAD